MAMVKILNAIRLGLLRSNLITTIDAADMLQCFCNVPHATAICAFETSDVGETVLPLIGPADEILDRLADETRMICTAFNRHGMQLNLN